mmetsp:Transcript_18874/g.24521  ORF Transcript_18874/g.24521 Transcript_18874/m.24521 type:complete len:217 (-) Transcript_18874:241-891(-)
MTALSASSPIISITSSYDPLPSMPFEYFTATTFVRPLRLVPCSDLSSNSTCFEFTAATLTCALLASYDFPTAPLIAPLKNLPTFFPPPPGPKADNNVEATSPSLFPKFNIVPRRLTPFFDTARTFDVGAGTLIPLNVLPNPPCFAILRAPARFVDDINDSPTRLFFLAFAFFGLTLPDDEAASARFTFSAADGASDRTTTLSFTAITWHANTLASA